jgi:hypothetical protein
MNFSADLPGAAFGIALLVALPALLIRGSGRILALIPLAPLLGTLGMAPVLPALAALAFYRRDRIVVALAGLTVTAMAEAVTGRSLLFARFAEVSGQWKQSVPAFISDLMIPIFASSTFLVAAVVWASIAVLLGAVVSRLRHRGETARPRVIRLAAVESERVPNAQ